jgi:hypothetical protein
LPRDRSHCDKSSIPTRERLTTVNDRMIFVQSSCPIKTSKRCRPLLISRKSNFLSIKISFEITVLS